MSTSIFRGFAKLETFTKKHWSKSLKQTSILPSGLNAKRLIRSASLMVCKEKPLRSSKPELEPFSFLWFVLWVLMMLMEHESDTFPSFPTMRTYFDPDSDVFSELTSILRGARGWTCRDRIASSFLWSEISL